MNGKMAFGALLVMTLGLAGGWLLRERMMTADPVDGVTKSGVELAFDEWSASADLEGAAVGFCVLNERGELVFGSPLAETALCPASAFKTLTAGAAFGLLGGEFRFVTTLGAQGGMSAAGVVQGDLVLIGGGDPTLSQEDLEALAARAVEGGLKQVTGGLRTDTSVFPGSPVSDHWVWGDLGNAYGAGAFGLNVGHNVVRLAFNAGSRIGDPGTFKSSEPDLSDLARFDLAVTTGPAGSGDRVMIYSSPYSDRIEARGTIPLGENDFGVRAAVPDPPALAVAILKRALEARGVKFDGTESASALPVTPITRHESALLPEIIDHMQDVSDNLEAQCLFLTVGAKQGGDPAAVLKSYWESLGVSFEGLRVIDGSGLARATMIRPIDLAKANLAARRSSYGERFVQSLPTNNDGTVRSKRGAMSGVRTEVGFVTRDGKEYVFALMANGLDPRTDFWKLRTKLLDSIGE